MSRRADKGRSTRFGWIFAALFADAVMGFLSFTPLVWEIGGRGEAYPELLYAGLGLPMALIGTVAAGVLAWSAAPAASAEWPVQALKAVVMATVAVCLGLTLLLWPLCPLPPPGLLDGLFSVALPALGVTVIVSSIAVIRRRPKRIDAGRG